MPATNSGDEMRALLAGYIGCFNYLESGYVHLKDLYRDQPEFAVEVLSTVNA
ncbi:Uu.00g084390.m01.CDS01 [Anthostomella pinea]|uniref:Uu.00g084390.m01.CDS01 n=1 Tax=Anthostomella pinea TaxID=933095 RepID=A0AAI8VGC9_9PEZI|nr:Uu.00g084390.m01.CDS01 [Anthostomella pinea]